MGQTIVAASNIAKEFVLAITDPELAAKLDAKREADAAKVLEKDAALQS